MMIALLYERLELQQFALITRDRTTGHPIILERGTQPFTSLPDWVTVVNTDRPDILDFLGVYKQITFLSNQTAQRVITEETLKAVKRMTNLKDVKSII
jgi:hypothetical protein